MPVIFLITSLGSFAAGTWLKGKTQTVEYAAESVTGNISKTAQWVVIGGGLLLVARLKKVI